MPYIDRTYIESKLRVNYLSEVLPGDTDGVDEVKLEGLIDDAESEVNLKLSRRYVMPAHTPDNNMKRLSFAIFNFFLESSRTGVEIAKDIELRYKNALKELTDIAAGILSLPDGVADELANPAVSSSVSTNKTSSDKIYTAEFLNKMP